MKEQWKRSKVKWQVLMEIFAYSFTFSLCERVLRLTNIERKRCHLRPVHMESSESKIFLWYLPFILSYILLILWSFLPSPSLSLVWMDPYRRVIRLFLRTVHIEWRQCWKKDSPSCSLLFNVPPSLVSYNFSQKNLKRHFIRRINQGIDVQKKKIMEDIISRNYVLCWLFFFNS